MPKLSYNASWSEDDEVEIEEALHLTEQQTETLFVQKGKIVISAEQAAALAKLSEDDDDTSNTPADTHNDDRAGEDDDKEAGDTIDKSIASQRDRDAVNVGNKLSKETGAHITAGYLARERVNITPLIIFQDLRRDLKDDLAALPVPNSRREQGKTIVGSGDTKRELGSNDPWDRYTFMDTNDNGKQVKRQGSYFKSMFMASTLGTEITKQLDLVDKAIGSTKDNGPACPKEYEGMGKPKLARRKSLFASRINFGIAQLKKAVVLDKQCRAFDSLSQVGYGFETEKNDKGADVFVNMNEPVQLFKVEKKDGREREIWHANFSISAFNKFDVAAAIKAAGGASNVTLEHITDTVKRDTDKDKNKNKTKDADWSKHEIGKIDEAQNLINSLVSYFYVNPATDDVQDKRINALHTLASKDKEMLLSLGDLAMILDDWYTKNKNEYVKAQRERLATALKEKEQRDVQREVA
jgi:hypothetical protein